MRIINSAQWASRLRLNSQRDMQRLGILFLVVIMIIVPLGGCARGEQKTITAFCGSVSKPAMEEAAQVFEEKTGIRVYLNFGGSGTMLSQMKISRTGDLYIPGSPDYMEKAKHDGVIEPNSMNIISYLIPAILVQYGNPKEIKALYDLAGPGIKVGIADPESVSIGLYAYEILEYSNLLAGVGDNIVTYGESVSRIASLVVLKSIDAILGWRILTKWQPDNIEVVYLKPGQIPRLSYITGAVSTFAEDRESAQRFLDFLVSPQGQQIFSKWGYITSESEARKFAPDAEIGGEYKLPDGYKPLVK